MKLILIKNIVWVLACYVMLIQIKAQDTWPIGVSSKYRFQQTGFTISDTTTLRNYVGPLRLSSTENSFYGFTYDNSSSTGLIEIFKSTFSFEITWSVFYQGVNDSPGTDAFILNDAEDTLYFASPSSSLALIVTFSTTDGTITNNIALPNIISWNSIALTSEYVISGCIVTNVGDFKIGLLILNNTDLSLLNILISDDPSFSFGRVHQTDTTNTTHNKYFVTIFDSTGTPFPFRNLVLEPSTETGDVVMGMISMTSATNYTIWEVKANCRSFDWTQSTNARAILTNNAEVYWGFTLKTSNIILVSLNEETGTVLTSHESNLTPSSSIEAITEDKDLKTIYVLIRVDSATYLFEIDSVTKSGKQYWALSSGEFISIAAK